MIYRNLGRSGLKVSAVSIGNWINSNKEEDLERNEKILKRAWELGINFFDTAELYGLGEGERQMGRAIKKFGVPRSNLVLSTKIYWGFHPSAGDVLEVNQKGACRKHVIEAMDRSLKNLDEKYVDIVFVHRYDLDTPTEEICRAFDDIVRSGKALYWGTSEWPMGLIMDAIHICEKYNLIKPIADQCQYNLLERHLVDFDYYYLFKTYGYGTTVWSPLANGFLTGKYNNGMPENTRISTNQWVKRLYESFDKKYGLPDKLKKLQAICDKLGVKMSQLALAWCIYNKDVSTAITGATTLDQLEESLKCLEVLPKLTKEVLQEIEDAMGTRPTQYQDFRVYEAETNNFKYLPARRDAQQQCKIIFQFVFNKNSAHQRKCFLSEMNHSFTLIIYQLSFISRKNLESYQSLFTLLKQL